MSDKDETESATENGAHSAQGLNQSLGESSNTPASEVAPEKPADGSASAGAAASLPVRGLAVNQTVLAQIVGVTDVTLWEWQKDGLPILQRGERGQSNLYDTAEVFKWKIGHEVRKASGPESQKDRLSRLQADRLQIELDQLRGQSIPAAVIEPAWTGIVNAVKQALLPLGLRLASILETTPGIDAKRELIDEEVHEVLTKLSAYGGSERPAGPGAQGDAALRAAGADSADYMG